MPEAGVGASSDAEVLGAANEWSMTAATSGTVSCHTGREDLSRLGVHAPPLDLSSTYPLHDLDAAEEAFEAFEHGDLAETIYARLHNPTVGRFERALAQLEGTETAVAFGSGMAAITACLLTARADGEHVVALRPLYGGTDALLASGLLGLDVSWARTGALRRSLHPATSLVLLGNLGRGGLAALPAASAAVHHEG